MARLPALHRESLPLELQHYFDRIVLTRGTVTGPFPVLLHSPDVATRVANVGAFLLYDAVLSPAVKSLAALLAAREYDCDYQWETFAPQAQRAGIPLEAINAIRGRTPPTGLNREHALVVDFCHQLLRGNHHVSDTTYRATVEHFGVAVTVQIAIWVGYLVMLAFSINAFEVTSGPEEAGPPL